VRALLSPQLALQQKGINLYIVRHTLITPSLTVNDVMV